MQVADFAFELPNELIARYPEAERTASRLLVVNGNSGEIQDTNFTHILDSVKPGDLFIFNNTRVIPARIFGRKATGGKLEVLVERVLDTSRILAHVRASKAPKEGAALILGTDRDQEFSATMVKRHDALFEIVVAGDTPILEILNKVGHMPLPPYIDRPDEDADKERYQTVYSKKPGAVAAPTAGLHFDETILEKIVAKGAKIEFVTLHVGAGTFQPVRVAKIEDHHMHSEYVEVPENVVASILETKAAGNRVVAVGTTSVRSLESAAQHAAKAGKPLAPFFGNTSIFIYPGYEFLLVDAMVTNFHLPESTLLMLVSAFAGYDHIMGAYKHAVEQKYRFFSYGDAMFLTKQTTK